MIKQTKRPQIFGYARASTLAQDTSCDQQQSKIEAYAAELAQEISGDYAGTRQEPGTSAVKISFDVRPVFQALYHELEPGDHLVVWKLDRIERNPFRLPAAINLLTERGVVVHTLSDFGGMRLRLDTAMGRTIVLVLSMVNDLFIEQLKENIRRALQWNKENGLAPARAGFGQRAVGVGEVNSRGRQRKQLVWDQRECRAIMEIVERRQNGESFRSIARDFYNRELKTARGHQWVRMYHDRQHRKHMHDPNKLVRAYKRFQQWVAEGVTFEGLPVDLVEKAKALSRSVASSPAPEDVADS